MIVDERGLELVILEMAKMELVSEVSGSIV